MEELRTSRALEDEILNDARRKAERILKNQVKEAEQLQAEREKALAADLAVLEEDFRIRSRDISNEFASAAPLAKKRKRLEYLDRTIRDHLDDYFAGQDGKSKMGMFTALIRRVQPVLGSDSLNVEYGGIEESQVRSILKNGLSDSRQLHLESRQDISGLVLLTGDGSKRYRATLDEVRNYLLRQYRETLMESLFGKGGPA